MFGPIRVQFGQEITKLDLVECLKLQVGSYPVEDQARTTSLWHLSVCRQLQLGLLK